MNTQDQEVIVIPDSTSQDSTPPYSPVKSEPPQPTEPPPPAAPKKIKEEEGVASALATAQRGTKPQRGTKGRTTSQAPPRNKPTKKTTTAHKNPPDFSWADNRGLYISFTGQDDDGSPEVITYYIKPGENAAKTLLRRCPRKIIRTAQPHLWSPSQVRTATSSSGMGRIVPRVDSPPRTTTRPIKHVDPETGLEFDKAAFLFSTMSLALSGAAMKDPNIWDTLENPAPWKSFFKRLFREEHANFMTGSLSHIVEPTSVPLDAFHMLVITSGVH